MVSEKKDEPYGKELGHEVYIDNLFKDTYVSLTL